MGRNNKAYHKDLHQQAYERLTGMQAFGQSKREAAANGESQDKIFSYNTYKTYWKHTKYFIRYIQSAHPECTTLKSAKKYVNEWLKLREAQDLSAWTVQTEAKALGILDDALLFDAKWYLRVKGKGGRVRISPIIGRYAGRIVERVQETPTDRRVWEYVSSNADIHSYRADYAGAIYKAYARRIEDIPFDGENQGTGRKFQKGVYTCRGDEAKKKLDKAAMLLCSKALGHNRLSIVADNYLRNL